MLVYGNSSLQNIRKSVIASFQHLDWKFKFAHKILYCYVGLFGCQLDWEKFDEKVFSQTSCLLIRWFFSTWLNFADRMSPRRRIIVQLGCLCPTHYRLYRDNSRTCSNLYRHWYRRWKVYLIITNLYIFPRTRSSLFCLHSYKYLLWLGPKKSSSEGVSIFYKNTKTIFYHILTVNNNYALVQCGCLFYNSFHSSQKFLPIILFEHGFSQLQRKKYIFKNLERKLEAAFFDGK